jgi:hypothetical protein
MARPSSDKYLASLLEPVTAFPGGTEGDAVRTGLLFVPAGADPHLQATARNDVQAGDHVGQDGYGARPTEEFVLLARPSDREGGRGG